MIHEHCIGQIQDISERGEVVITATLPNLEKALDRKYQEVEIIFQDGRRITPRQRRAVFAIIGEIAEFVEGFKNAVIFGDSLSRPVVFEENLAVLHGKPVRLKLVMKDADVFSYRFY